MKVQFVRLLVDGYGRFLQPTGFQLHEGLNLITGANESGKSTLLSALLDALYANPNSTAKEVRERVHFRHPEGWRIELELLVGDTPIRVIKRHTRDSPNRRAEFQLAVGEEVYEGSFAQARWQQEWRFSREVYLATACVRQRELARLAEGKTLASLQQQLRESALTTDLQPVLKAIQERRKKLNTELQTLEEQLAPLQNAYAQAKQQTQEYQMQYAQLRQNRERIAELGKSLTDEQALLERWNAFYTKKQRVDQLREQVQRAHDWLRQYEALQTEKEELERVLNRYRVAQIPAEIVERARTLYEQYQNARRNTEELGQRLEGVQSSIQQVAGQARARKGLLLLGGALLLMGIWLTGQGHSLGLWMLGLSAVPIAIGLLWRSKTLSELSAKAQLLREQMEQYQRERSASEQELARTLAQAGVLSEDSFRTYRNGTHHALPDAIASAYSQLEREWREVEELRTRLRTVQTKLDTLAQVDRYEAVKEQYRTMSVELVALETELERDTIAQQLMQIPPEQWAKREMKLESDKEELTRLREESLRLEGRLESLIPQTDPEELALQIQQKQAGRESTAHQIQVLDLTRELLESANERYLQDISPRLKPCIEKYLPALTQNRYRTLSLDSGLEIRVHHPDRGEELPLDENLPAWSAGTLDQLFFACRLGLCEVISGGYRLPLLLDDPLVYSDEARFQQALELLTQIATQTQVLYFTCRPITIDGAHTITL